MMQNYLASTSEGLETLLKQEITSLGGDNVLALKGAVSFQYDRPPYELILKTRLASRVYKHLIEREIKSSKDIYKMAKDFPWHHLFDVKKSFKIHTILTGDRLEGRFLQEFKNSLYISQVAKDGLVDRFRLENQGRPSVDTRHPEVALLLHLVFDSERHSFKASLLVDLCGESLGQRFYREGHFSAPLKEPLACGMLQLMKWNPQEEIFVDSMCGSGTVLIEALMLKGKIPPSFLRVRLHRRHKTSFWNLEYLKDFNPHLWEESLKKIEEETLLGEEFLKKSPITLFGCDRDSVALDMASRHLQKVGGEPFVSLKRQDATVLKPIWDAPGVIFCNPPYGKRLQTGEDEALKKLYYAYGENMKSNFKGWKSYIFTTEKDLRKAISLRTNARHPLFNGPLEGRLYEYLLY